MSQNATTLQRQMPVIIPEVWSLSLNKKLDKSGVAMKAVNKIYEKDIKDFGDTVNIGEIGDVTVSDYSEDTSEGGVTYQRVSATTQQLKLDQSKYFGIFLSDITVKQSNIEALQQKFENRAKTAIDLVKDTFVLSAFSEIAGPNKLGDTKVDPKNIYSVFAWLARTLKNNNAIQTKEDKVFKDNQAADGALPYVIINPDVESILVQAPEFIHATNAGDTVLREGSIGKIAGLDVLVSTNLPTSAHKVNIMAGINEAIAYAGNVSKVEVMRDTKFFGTNVRGLYVYGKKVVNPKALAGATLDVTFAETVTPAAGA